jgi:hypothetical protein
MSILSRHVAFTRLVDLAENRLAPADQEQVKTHTSECHRCDAELNRLISAVSLMRTDSSEEPPANVVKRSMALFRTYVAPSGTSVVERLIASLKFDSWSMTPTYGVRSGQSSQRQILFVAREYDLDLRIAPGDEGWVVLGQAFGPECFGGRIELEGDSGISHADLNDQCEFSLPPVPTGKYTLRLCLPSTVVEIPAIELRPDGA